MWRNAQAWTQILAAVLAVEPLPVHSEGSRDEDQNLQQVIVTGSYICGTLRNALQRNALHEVRQWKQLDA